MNQVLSQSEVDALLAAVSEGEVGTADTSGGGGGSASASNSGSMSAGGVKQQEDKVVVTYDLTSQDRIIRGRLPQLEVIYEIINAYNESRKSTYKMERILER